MGAINQFKTVILLGLLTALMLGIGSFWGQNGLIIGLAISVVMNVGSYWFSDKIVLAMYRVKPITKNENKELYDIVTEVAEETNIPMPKVYIIPTDAPNAFATGRNPKHAAIAATNGIIRLLTRDELKGVIAHEAAHIKNRDTLIQVVAATIASVISFIAMFARFGVGGNDDNKGNAIGMLVLAILAPLIATIIQLAISRSREFIADESAAKTIHSSFGLANALQKLESSNLKIPFGSETTSSLFIVNPFKGASMWKLFSTHPPTSERVKKLKELNL